MSVTLTQQDRSNAIVSNTDKIAELIYNRTSFVRAVHVRTQNNTFDGVFIGTIFNNKFIKSDEQLYRKLRDDSVNNRVIIDQNRILMYKSDKNLKLLKINKNIKCSLFDFNVETVSLFDIVIKDSELSAKVFGLKKDKTTLIGTKFKSGEYTIEYGRSNKLDSNTYYINVPFEGSNSGFVKFVIRDVEFVIPEFKGWNFPKDKSILENDKVVIRKDPDKQVWNVVAIQANNTSKLLCKNGLTRCKDIIRISNGKIIKNVYAKYLKKVC